MELRNIETFLSIVEYGTFSKAAERLGYSQSAVTVQIRQLENELGVRLFDRAPRGVRLTDPGRAFAFHANEVMGAVRLARDAASIGGEGPKDVRGAIRLGSVESVSTALLPDLLIEFHERCPHVQVIVSTDRREDMMAGLTGPEIRNHMTGSGESPMYAPGSTQEQDIELAAVRFVCELFSRNRHLSEGSIGREAHPELLERIAARGIPVHGRPLDDVVREMQDDIIGYGYNIDHARFLGFVPGPVTAVSWLGDMMAGLTGNAIDLLLTMERHVCLGGIDCEVLREERVAFLASPTFLREWGVEPDAPLAAADLALMPFVLTERGESYRLELDRLLADRDVAIEPLVEAGNTETHGAACLPGRDRLRGPEGRAGGVSGVSGVPAGAGRRTGCAARGRRPGVDALRPHGARGELPA